MTLFPRDGEGVMPWKECSVMDERLHVEMARPEGFEPPILCLEADRTLLPNLARGGATGAVSASSGNSPQRTFSFVFPDSLTFCRCFPQLALRFRDSTFSRHNEFFRSPDLYCPRVLQFSSRDLSGGSTRACPDSCYVSSPRRLSACGQLSCRRHRLPLVRLTRSRHKSRCCAFCGAYRASE